MQKQTVQNRRKIFDIKFLYVKKNLKKLNIGLE